MPGVVVSGFMCRLSARLCMTLCLHQAKCHDVQGLRHPNIVTLCGACWDASNTLMVSELMPFNLFDILYKMGSVTLQTVNCIKIGIDICRAFRYLHSRTPQIIHRCMCLPMHWLSAFPNDLSPPKSNLIEH